MRPLYDSCAVDELGAGSPVYGRLECVCVLASTRLCVALRAHILGVASELWSSFVIQRSMFSFLGGLHRSLLGLTWPLPGL